MQNRDVKMEVVNPNAAGIDVEADPTLLPLVKVKKRVKSTELIMKTISSSCLGSETKKKCAGNEKTNS